MRNLAINFGIPFLGGALVGNGGLRVCQWLFDTPTPPILPTVILMLIPALCWGFFICPRLARWLGG